MDPHHCVVSVCVNMRLWTYAHIRILGGSPHQVVPLKGLLYIAGTQDPRVICLFQIPSLILVIGSIKLQSKSDAIVFLPFFYLC